MISGKTETGFEFNIDKRVLEDWNFVELLAKADEGDLSASIRAFKMLLGEDQYNNLKTHLTDKDGFLSSESMSEALVEIMTSTQDLKN